MYMYEYIASAFNSFCGPQKCVIFLGNREMSSSTWFRIWNDNATNIFLWEGVGLHRQYNIKDTSALNSNF